VLVVLRSRFEDIAGRVAALRLTPLVFRSDPRAIWRPKELLDVLRQAIPVADIGLVDAGWRTWASRSEETLERFWRARRERELGAAPPCSAPASLQPGLFDRRAEREWQSLQQDQAEAAREAARRAAVVDLAASVSLSPPEISLVLIPGRVTR
jgi:hypothetical protein